MSSDTMKSRGFTLIELIVVMIVVGILAVVVLPRFNNQADFAQAGFRLQAEAALQYARKIAVASRRYVCVSSSGNVLSFWVDVRLPENASAPFCQSGARTALLLPGSSTASIAAPDGVSLGAADFYFDPQGQASAAQSLTITGGNAIVVELSGYVH